MSQLLEAQAERRGILPEEGEDSFALADPAAIALIQSAAMMQPVADTLPPRQFGFVPQPPPRAKSEPRNELWSGASLRRDNE
jgi:hypothetical protein